MDKLPDPLWRLPPQQRVLKQGETIFDLNRVARELTVVMSTSVGDFTPSVEPVIAALESLQANLALRWCRKVLVFDKVPSKEDIEEMQRDRHSYNIVTRGSKWARLWNEKRRDYDEYCSRLRQMKDANHPALLNTDLVFLSSFGHLFGTVKKALGQLDTRYVFITQHDLKLGGHFVAADVQIILEALHGGYASYIVLNRDVNSAYRTTTYFRMVPDRSVQLDPPPDQQKPGLSLTGMAGFSDQAHFAEADWYRKEVIDAIPQEQQLTCMEHVLHDIWKDSADLRNTFLYGGLSDGPYVLDLIYGAQVYNAAGKLQRLPPPPARTAA